MLSSFIHVVVYISISFLVNNLPRMARPHVFIYSPGEDYFGCLHFLTITIKVAMDTCVQVSVAHVFSFGGCIPGVELLGHMLKLITGYLYIQLFEELPKCFPQR